MQVPNPRPFEIPYKIWVLCTVQDQEWPSYFLWWRSCLFLVTLQLHKKVAYQEWDLYQFLFFFRLNQIQQQTPVKLMNSAEAVLISPKLVNSTIKYRENDINIIMLVPITNGKMSLLLVVVTSMRAAKQFTQLKFWVIYVTNGSDDVSTWYDATEKKRINKPPHAHITHIRPYKEGKSC